MFIFYIPQEYMNTAGGEEKEKKTLKRTALFIIHQHVYELHLLHPVVLLCYSILTFHLAIMYSKH